MKKQDMFNQLKLILLITSTFLISYLLRLHIVVSVFLLSLVVYIEYRDTYLKRLNILKLALLLAIILFISRFIVDQQWPEAYIPFIVMPMLITLLFNQLELSLLITLAQSILIASISGNYLHSGVLFFTSGLFASILVFNARRRMTVLRAGFMAGILQAALLLCINQFWVEPQKVQLASYVTMALNGVISSIIVLGVLPFFEYFYKSVTNISLLELADFQHPLLQRLILEAPGTYHHSLIVGNLSDAACVAVGANGLLARIGAYYHDIGKLQKPEYFSENQDVLTSKHDTISPTISKMVIINHVREGLELARRHRLSPPILNFIQQHHGNSLVFYFYRRALESLEEEQGIKEEGFRYPGPKPNTRETAIVLLADSVEAATRALKEPTPVKIEEVVHKIINNRFIDGQLDECDLTLKDLEKISNVFIRILGAMYHSRVTYPEEQGREDSNKKSAKKNSYLSEKDKKSNS